MADRERSKRYATYSEMRDGLRNAADHVTLMMNHEVDAANALERFGNAADVAESERLFLRDFKAFIAEVRSVRDYMTAASKKTKNASWIEGRFKSIETKDLFEFFNALMNQTLHQYRPTLEPRSNKIQYVAEPGSVMQHTPIGTFPNRMRVIGVLDAKYHFLLSDLDERAEKAFEVLLRRFPGETVIMLCVRYHEGLSQILKNAERNQRFDDVSK